MPRSLFRSFSSQLCPDRRKTIAKALLASLTLTHAPFAMAETYQVTECMVDVGSTLSRQGTGTPRSGIQFYLDGEKITPENGGFVSFSQMSPGNGYVCKDYSCQPQLTLEQYPPDGKGQCSAEASPLSCCYTKTVSLPVTSGTHTLESGIAYTDGSVLRSDDSKTVCDFSLLQADRQACSGYTALGPSIFLIRSTP